MVKSVKLSQKCSAFLIVILTCHRFQGKNTTQKNVLDNLFEFEQDGSSSDLPELVVETTSSKTSFLEKLEAELTDDKPKAKEGLKSPKPDITDEKEDKDKTKKKKKKKQLEGIGSREIKEPKSDTKMPALAKMSKVEAAAAEAKKPVVTFSRKWMG